MAAVFPVHSFNPCSDSMRFIQPFLQRKLAIYAKDCTGEVYIGNLYCYDGETRDVILHNVYEVPKLDTDQAKAASTMIAREFVILKSENILAISDGVGTELSDTLIPIFQQKQKQAQTLASLNESVFDIAAQCVGKTTLVNLTNSNSANNHSVQVGTFVFLNFKDNSIVLRVVRGWKGAGKSVEYDRIGLNEIEDLKMIENNIEIDIGHLLFPFTFDKLSKSNEWQATYCSPMQTLENDKWKSISHTSFESHNANNASQSEMDASNVNTNTNTKTNTSNIGNKNDDGDIDDCLNYYLFNQ